MLAWQLVLCLISFSYSSSLVQERIDKCDLFESSSANHVGESLVFANIVQSALHLNYQRIKDFIECYTSKSGMSHEEMIFEKEPGTSYCSLQYIWKTQSTPKINRKRVILSTDVLEICAAGPGKASFWNHFDQKNNVTVQYEWITECSACIWPTVTEKGERYKNIKLPSFKFYEYLQILIDKGVDALLALESPAPAIYQPVRETSSVEKGIDKRWKSLGSMALVVFFLFFSLICCLCACLTHAVVDEDFHHRNDERDFLAQVFQIAEDEQNDHHAIEEVANVPAPNQNPGEVRNESASVNSHQVTNNMQSASAVQSLTGSNSSLASTQYTARSEEPSGSAVVEDVTQGASEATEMKRSAVKN
ncbi:unnamed protein product [Caenorhabditis auriculariae]|uniref:Uncharacterized protein n=1 Tax=Caenorhabditis auriculariae TaxID=2777116 RepID=A0A8S1HVZ5_9PELO|nr:unnamed protein product [Caenorhabditis auriculariae]